MAMEYCNSVHPAPGSLIRMLLAAVSLLESVKINLILAAAHGGHGGGQEVAVSDFELCRRQLHGPEGLEVIPELRVLRLECCLH